MELRYRAIVEYDGTGFEGFQVQARGRTVQGELERAIESITQVRVRILAAGRTDAGVHAAGQVIAFDVSPDPPDDTPDRRECRQARGGWRHTVQDLHRALNAVLPADIAIRHLATTSAGFHPRFDARWRRYRYTILNCPVRSPLWARYAHHVPDGGAGLDLEAMRQASHALIGSHDFAAFGRPMVDPRGRPQRGTKHGEPSTVRSVRQAEWYEFPVSNFEFGVSSFESHQKLFIFEITANAFLYRMVRNIVGTLLRVGRGELSPDDVAAILQAGAGGRAAVGPPAPACGLCLMSVEYQEQGNE
jgi:tRNA pseudouridine38-40 synthase